MENASNKKRTAVVASAVAAALLLSGTFAWNMATDQTKLNEFQASDPGDYNVKLNENFDPSDPWANKDVYVTNISDNPVIVRVRLEEFYDLLYRNGTEYNTPEGFTNGDAGGSAIFTPDADDTLNDDNTADSATKLNEKISLLFGAGVVTMAEYNAMDANAKAEVKWVVDTDGWCYYTQALLAGETTEYLLDKATFNKDVFDAAYDSPYNLDYRINVRLQAISADLEDFGAKDNTAQWTNIDSGRVIAATENPFEIIADSAITADARNLVIDIENTYTNPYANDDGSIAVAVSTFAEFEAAVKDDSIHSILLTNDIEMGTASDYSPYLNIKTDKFIELGHYAINRSTTTSTQMFVVSNGATLVFKHGTINAKTSKLISVTDGNLELVDVQAISEPTSYMANCAISVVGSAKFYNSNVTFSNSYTGSTTNINKIIGAISLAANSDLYLSNSTITSNIKAGIRYAATGSASSDIVLKNSVVEGADNGIVLWKDWTLTAKNSTISGNVAITENHNYSPKSAVLEGCTLEATQLGFFKVADHPLTMTDCDVNVTAVDGGKSTGLFLRSGDITLDSVDITVNQGTGSDVIRTDAELEAIYNLESGTSQCTVNYEALQIILNSYENVNLNIIGGSYATNVAGAKSVYIYDKGYSIKDSTYDYNNTITISGNPTFSPETSAFDQDYAHTTINK